MSDKQTSIDRLFSYLKSRGRSWTTSRMISEEIGTPCASTRVSDLRQYLDKYKYSYAVETKVYRSINGTVVGAYRLIKL